MKNPLLTTAACLALASPLMAQRFEGILSVRSSSMPAAAGMQYFIKGERLRLELTAPGQSPIVMISDALARKQYTLFPDQKVYTTTTFTELLRATDSIRKQSAALLQGGSMTPTSATTTVAGHKCTVHHYRDAKTAYDICLTTELGAVSGAPGLFGNISPSLDTATPPQWVEALLKAGSFALRLSDTTGKTLWEVRKVTAQTLSASLFSPPADFASASDSAAANAKRPPLD